MSSACVEKSLPADTLIYKKKIVDIVMGCIKNCNNLHDITLKKITMFHIPGNSHLAI